MTVNPAGFQCVMDGGNPRIISGYARQYISGGQLVFTSGAADVVSSGANSFVTSDILFASAASGAQFVGIALANAGSNTPLAVATKGVFIVTANGTVTASYNQMVDGNDAVQDAGSVAGNLAALRQVGKALVSATSGGYTLLYL